MLAQNVLRRWSRAPALTLNRLSVIGVTAASVAMAFAGRRGDPPTATGQTHPDPKHVVESPFATVRLRQGVTKGNGSLIKGLTMAYKLLDMAENRWRRLDGAALLPLVRAGRSSRMEN